MKTAMRWSGVVALLANTFLSQELLRLMSEHMDRVSAGERFVVGGWIRLSGAAWPATWIYWASHIWTIVAIRDMRSSTEAPSRALMDGVLTALVVLEIILIHGLVVMFRGSWHIRPAFLW